METSSVARSCIGLLLECADYLATHYTPEGGVAGKGEEKGKEKGEDSVKSKHGGGGGGGKREGEEERGVFWSTLKSGLTSNSWTTRYKTGESDFSLILE